MQVNIHEAKAHLSRLLARVAEGEEIVSARAGRPVARLVHWEEPSGIRRLGRDRGLFTVRTYLMGVGLPSEPPYVAKPRLSPQQETDWRPDSAMVLTAPCEKG